MTTEPGIPDAFESNAGDDFHLQWAARKAIGMLHPYSTLMGIGLDQVHPDDVGRVELGGDSLLGIDLAEYYGGKSFRSANEVVHSQLKYSTRQANKPWTASKLSPAGKASKKCVIRRLADVYSHYEQKFGREETLKKLKIKLISNRPCDRLLYEALLHAKRLLSTRSLSVNTARLLKDMTSAQVRQINYLRRGVSLKSSEFTDFLRVFDVSECGAPSRLAMDAALFEKLGELGFGEARSRYSMLMDSIRRRMQPENRGERPLIKPDVLAALEVTDLDLLYPAPASFEQLPNPIQRENNDDWVGQITDHDQGMICIHGEGGVGKTTVIHQLCDSLPSGSVSVLFDCYGGGSYMNHESKRHGYQRAILQISNELAGKIGTPLLINLNFSEEDYSRELSRRLKAASRLVRTQSPDALVVLVIDAADNSLSAAENWGEKSFVSGLVTMAVPNGCRLVFTARTHRRDKLGPLANALHLEVPRFTVAESKQHIDRFCGESKRADVDAFRDLTHGIPRTQAYALSQCGGDLENALDFLRPGGKTLNHLIDTWLVEAGQRLGDASLAEKICPALLTLARPVPARWAAKLSNIDEGSLVDFCQDAGLGFTVRDGAVGFKDEDFEERIAQRFGTNDQRYGLLADALLSARNADGYAAAHVADSLRAAGRTKDIVQLVHNDGQPESIEDPIERTEVFARRAQLAMDWVMEEGDEAELLRLLFVLAESGKADQAVEELLLREGDLAVRYGNPTAVHRLYINQQNVRLDWQGPMHLQCAAQFSRNATSHIQAKSHLASAEAWIRKYYARPSDERRDWDLSTDNIVDGAEAVLRLNGISAAYKWIASWRPKAFRFELCHKLANRIFVSDCPIDSESIWQLLPRHEELLAIIDGAVNAGHIPPKRFIAHVAKQWVRYARSGRRVDAGLCRPGVSLCESAARHQIAKRTIHTLLKLFTPPSTSHTSFSNVEELEERYGCRLRAATLLAVISNRDIKFTDKCLYPPKPEIHESGDGDEELRRWEEKQKSLEECYSYLFPAYSLRAQAIRRGTSLADAEKMFETALGPRGHEWEWRSERYEKRLLARLRARVLADGVIFLFEDPADHFLELYEHTKRSHPAWMTKDLAERAVRVSVLADQAMTIVADYIDSIKSPSPASERVDAFTWACRIGGQISLSDGRTYFEQAVEAAGEIDSECAAMLQLLAQIADNATSGTRTDHDDIAVSMAAIVEDSYMRWRDGGREFPWNELVDAIARLSPRTAIAALGRWDQRNILKYKDELARLSVVLVARGCLSWRVAVSVAAYSPITHRSALDWGLRVLDRVKHNNTDENDVLIGESLAILADRACRLLTADRRKQAIDDFIRWADEHGYHDYPAIMTTRSYQSKIDIFQSSDVARGKPWGPSHTNKPVNDTYDVSIALESDRVKDCNPFDANAISNVIKEEYTTAQKRKMQWEQLRSLPIELLNNIRQKVPIADRTRYLDAVVRITTSHVSLTDLIDYLLIVRNDWQNTPTVRYWFVKLPSLLAEVRFSQFVYHEYIAWDILTKIKDAFGTSIDAMGRALLKAAPPHVRSLSPEVLYDLGRLIVPQLASDSALDLLRWVTERLSQEIDEATLACRSLDVAHIAPSGTGLAAAIFWFLMGHPDKQVRWQAIHTVRGTVKLGDSKILDELAKWIDCDSSHPFYSGDSAFYWLSAKTWYLILIDRLSEEIPDAIISLRSLLVVEAIEPNTPHVMTMYLARNAAMRLAKHDPQIYSSETMDAIKHSLSPEIVNTEAAPDNENTYQSDDYRRSKRTRFEFDWTDTLPYWYAPAGRVFGIDGDKFCDDVSAVIIDEWRIPVGARREDPVHKWLVPDHKWGLCSNDHGSEPMIEDLRTYLEFHAMMCVMARYAQTLPAQPERWGEGSAWDHWLRGWGLSSSTKWHADSREPTPLESDLWTWSERFDDKWLKSIDDRNFDQAIGLDRKDVEGHLVIGGSVSRYQYDGRESVRIFSALVSPGTSEALLRALCQCHIHDYRIPPENDDLELDDKLVDGTALTLRGWLKQNYSDFSGLDQYDPFRFGIKNNQSIPGQIFRKWLESQSDDVTWYQNWNDCPEPEENHNVFTVGNRFWIKRNALKEFLTSVSSDLIVECDVTRSLDSRYSSTNRDSYAQESKLYLIKADGTIIGRRSDPEPRPEART